MSTQTTMLVCTLVIVLSPVLILFGIMALVFVAMIVIAIFDKIFVR